jgi:ceramide glucosyltransferase
MEQPKIGLVNVFYTLADCRTLAMRWEAVAINADFWSQVLQSATLKPLDFALGAVMITRQSVLAEIGGFSALKDCLADDYQLGNRIAARGYQIALGTVVAECRSEPMGWAAVWRHQLRWARTIRVCQPLPYFFSILSNGTVWPLLLLAATSSIASLWLAAGLVFVRTVTALHLQSRIGKPLSAYLAWLVPLKDLLQFGVWGFAFLGNTVEWRGERLRIMPDGTLLRATR